MAKILLVHGAFHELWGPNEITTRWLPALRDGLWHHGAEIDASDVAAAFYGDLFRPDPEVGGTETAAAARQAGAEAIAAQIPGGVDALPGIEAAAIGRVVDCIGPDTEIVVAHSLGTLVSFAALRSRVLG